MNATHLIIFNRGAALTKDGWIHIVPKGDLVNREAGITQVLDEEALDSILRNIEADKQKRGADWPGIYAGREHFIYNSEQDSAALGWFKDFQKRDNGIWAKEDGLTDLGAEAVKNHRYKFTSFVADRRDTKDLGKNRFRILKIDTVGFTNMANGRELLTPIANREDFRPGTVPKADEPTKKDTMKSIATRLGLSADASEEGILGELNKLLNRVETAEKEITPLKNRITAIETDNTNLLNDQVLTLLDAHGVKEEKLRNRMTTLLTPLKNREERVAALIDCGHKAIEVKPNTQQQQLRNRDTRPANTETPGDENAERALAAKAEAEVQSYKLTNRCGYSEARNAVRMQKPELFGITAATN